MREINTECNREQHQQAGQVITDPILHVRHGAHLPHWQTKGCDGNYFITFRLIDTLPAEAIIKYKQERKLLLSCIKLGDPLSSFEKAAFGKLFCDKIDAYLDAGAGECWLKRSDIAQLVRDTLYYFDGDRYNLVAWCIMPNHVHVVIQLHKGIDLEVVTHSWKSFTAQKANRLLGRKGAFWQGESYDHMIRDDGEFLHYVKYTLENPRTAGLSNWPWLGVAEELIRGL